MCIRDSRSVRLQVVLQESYEHTGRGYHRVVEGVDKVAALVGLDPDSQTAGLGVSQVGAAAHLKVFLLPG